jgi:hypothetical protein
MSIIVFLKRDTPRPPEEEHRNAEVIDLAVWKEQRRLRRLKREACGRDERPTGSAS